MGSRTKPNHGGSGNHSSRKSRPKPDRKAPISYSPISSVSELNLYLSGDKIACLICGEEFKCLGRHVSRSHAISPREYKEKFNIPVTRSLSGEGLRDRKRKISKRNWQENPKMESVRKTLKENIDNLDGAKHKSKSTLSNATDMKKIKSIQNQRVREKYRIIYMEKMKEAIDKDVTLYSVFRSTCQIYDFAKRWPNDKEFIKLLSMVKKPDQAKSGDGKEEKLCLHCGKKFLSRKKRNSKTCNRECASKIRINRIKKNCAVCNKEMSLTPSDYKKLKTCGSKKCKSEYKTKKV